MIKKKPSIAVELLVEGQTEKFYFDEFKKEFPRFKFNIRNLKKGNYSAFIDVVKSFKSTERIIFVVVDLDRACNDKNELVKLKKLITMLEKNNKFNNIFLSNQNFETFLSANFDPFETKLCKRLNLSSNYEIKNRSNLYQLIIQHGGCFENCLKFSNNLYYSKIDDEKGQIIEENLYKPHTSLINFKIFCDYIEKKRKNKK